MNEKRRLLKVEPAVWKFAFLDNMSSPNLWGWHQARELLIVINNILASLGQKPMTTADLLREYPFITPCFKGESGRSYWHVDKDEKIWNTVVGAYENWLEELVSNDHFLPAGIGSLFIEAIKDPIESQKKKLAWMTAGQ